MSHYSSSSTPVKEIQVLTKYLTDSLLETNQRVQICSPYTQKIQSRFIPHHWDPTEPERGSGYRAISFDPTRQDGYLDPVLSILAQLLLLSNRDFRRIIIKNLSPPHSSGFTIWCDPGCVSIRLQASGGELREIWGHLPNHLSINRRQISHSPSPTLILNQRPTALLQSPLSNPSRAIPILAPPTSGTRLAITPPTPIEGYSNVLNSNQFEPEEEEEFDNVQSILTDHQNQIQLASYCSSLQDRPASRASCASSSSDGSDNSAFSSSSSSTATSIAPPGVQMAKKICPISFQNLVAPQFPTRYIRHHSSGSFPFVSLNNFSSATVNPLSTMPPLMCRATSPVYPGQRRRHMPSPSVSSTGTGRGLLVLKGGPGTVTEHSGGKVGVMGGGVLLGLPKDKESAAVVNANPRRVSNRRTRTRPSNL